MDDYIYKTSVESIIYGSFVKNDVLDKIVYEAFSNTSIASATVLNVFIDIYSVLHQVFSDFRPEYYHYPLRPTRLTTLPDALWQKYPHRH